MVVWHKGVTDHGTSRPRDDQIDCWKPRKLCPSPLHGFPLRRTRRSRPSPQGSRSYPENSEPRKPRLLPGYSISVEETLGANWCLPCPIEYWQNYSTTTALIPLVLASSREDLLLEANSFSFFFASSISEPGTLRRVNFPPVDASLISLDDIVSSHSSSNRKAFDTVGCWRLSELQLSFCFIFHVLGSVRAWLVRVKYSFDNRRYGSNVVMIVNNFFIYSLFILNPLSV